jgi:hypothetical protein
MTQPTFAEREVNIIREAFHTYCCEGEWASEIVIAGEDRKFPSSRVDECEAIIAKLGGSPLDSKHWPVLD